MPTLVGVLSASTSLAAAMGSCAVLSYLLVVIAAWMLPETRGRDLAEMDEVDDRAVGAGGPEVAHT